MAQIMPSEASEVTARTRTLKTEKRLAMRPEFKAIVEQQLKDLQADGISEVIPSKELLPHFSTEQTHLVFASCDQQKEREAALLS